MKEINIDMFEDYGKFELICLPCSTFQKRDTGELISGRRGFTFEFYNKFAGVSREIAIGYQRFGAIPYPCYTIQSTKYPTKICGFPITPPMIRHEDPDYIVYNRFVGKFKKNKMLPGCFIAPRSDVLEFSCIKLREVIKFYKLTSVAIPFEGFWLGEGDERHIDRVKKILFKFLGDDVYLTYQTQEASRGNIWMEKKDREIYLIERAKREEAMRIKREAKEAIEKEKRKNKRRKKKK